MSEPPSLNYLSEADDVSRVALSKETTLHENYNEKADVPETTKLEINDAPTFPDGGLRAWLVVFGVLHF